MWEGWWFDKPSSPPQLFIISPEEASALWHSLSLIHSPSLCETFQSYFMMMWWHLGFSHDSGVDVGMSVSRLGGPTIQRTAVTFCTDSHGSKRMNPDALGDSMTFPLVPPRGLHFCVCSKMSWQLLEQVFMDLRGGILMILVIPVRSPMKFPFVMSEMSWQLLDLLVWSLVHILLPTSAWIKNYLAFHPAPTIGQNVTLSNTYTGLWQHTHKTKDIPSQFLSSGTVLDASLSYKNVSFVQTRWWKRLHCAAEACGAAASSNVMSGHWLSTTC